MRVVYDKDTGRVAALGDAVEAGEGQAATELTPQESAALTDANAAVSALTAQLRTAVAAQQAAAAAYEVAAAAVKRAFGKADQRKGLGDVAYDPQAGFVVIAAAPAPEPTPEDDEALVMADPRMAALLRVLARQTEKG